MRLAMMVLLILGNFSANGPFHPVEVAIAIQWLAGVVPSATPPPLSSGQQCVAVPSLQPPLPSQPRAHRF